MLLSYIRTAILYCVLVGVIRLMGKRQIGQLEPSEFVVTMLIANLAAIPMQEGDIPLLSGLIPIVTVLGMELVLSGLMMRSLPLRRLLCGKPVILIDNGTVLQDNLRRTRVTLDELTGHLREKNVLDIRTVQYAILETDGNLSVFPYPAHSPAAAQEAGIQVQPHFLPVTVIQDGCLSEENLRKSGKDRLWLRKILEKNHASISQTFLLTVDGAGDVVFLKKEGQK